MRMLLAAGLAAVVIAHAGPAWAQDEATPAALIALQHWMDAVERHVPGQRDQWLEPIPRLTYRERSTLDPAMSAFLGLFAQPGAKQANVVRGDVQRRAAELASSLEQRGETVLFLKRAAILHADAAILRHRLGDIDDPTVPTARTNAPNARLSGRPVPPSTSPLLDNRQLLLSRDGQVMGQAQADWNWPFARSIVDLIIRVAPSGDGLAFAGDWYHTTNAFMVANGLYGEAVPHLDQAVGILPRDAKILFDRGCISELLGLPMQQILRGDWRPDRNVGIPSRDATNADAEAWFVRALEVDSEFVEARVRLARLLDVAGSHAQAMAEIDRALSSKPTGVPAYFAHLFGGRAAQALGRLEDARRHYSEASSLFPDAQSALLARSQAALLAGDVNGALEVTTRLGERTANLPADPWWSYHLGAGRDFLALLGSLWAQLRP